MIRGGSHKCHWPGCWRFVSVHQWGCNDHWYRLPSEIRGDICFTWYDKDPACREYALQAAQSWIKDDAKQAAAEPDPGDIA